MVVRVPAGVSKPYSDKDGVVWVKCGADKRKATARDEVLRMYQASALIHGDEVPVRDMTVEDVEMSAFSRFYEKLFEEPLSEQELPLARNFENLNLSRKGNLNVAGALLFGRNVEFKLPVFIVKCVAFPGDDIDVECYDDSEDISGLLENVYDRTMGFILRNLRRVQDGQGVNSLGKLEIPKIVFEELIVNALVHRDYFVSAPIRVLMFSDRIEIISPGHLPNNLTVENIKSGNSNTRNPILASFATKLLPYRGLGSGVRRALKEYPATDFVDDRDGNVFKCIVQAELAHKDSELAHKGSELAHKGSELAHKGSELAHKGSELAHKELELAHKEELTQIARAISTSKRSSQEEVERCVVALCRVCELSSQELAHLMNRDEKALRSHYLNPLCEKGMLRRKFAEKNHPRQKYLTVKE
jgi:ATP-dependent DNA helicase RecG